MDNKTGVTYTKEAPGRASLLFKKMSEKKALAASEMTVERYREALGLLADARPLPASMAYESVVCAGVPCEWVYPKNNCPDTRVTRVILYLHGGSWIFGNIKTSRAFAMYISEEFGCRVLVPDYRLAPENPYPAGLDDCFSVYSWLLANGYKPENIILFGDSAGGNLGLCLLNKLKSLGHKQPACMCAASPVTDLRPESSLVSGRPNLIYTIYEDEKQDIFTLYTQGESRENPFVSPIMADLSGIAPILIHTGGDEELAADNIAFTEKAIADGTNASVVVFRDMFHDFTVTGKLLRESRRSVADFVDFVESILAKPVAVAKD